MRILLSASLLITGLAACAMPAQANDSAYVRVFESCMVTEPDDEPVVFSDCTGYGGWRVHVVAGEHGIAIAYSQRGKETQWSENPPRIGVFQDLGEVSEWRLDASGVPFATIQRSIFSGFEPGDGGQYLTVAALRPDGEPGACHVAYIEAAQQSGANQIARDAADLLAPGWRCGVDAPVVFDLNSEMDVHTLAAQRRPGH